MMDGVTGSIMERNNTPSVLMNLVKVAVTCSIMERNNTPSVLMNLVKVAVCGSGS
jgi:hypothetical protein